MAAVVTLIWSSAPAAGSIDQVPPQRPPQVRVRTVLDGGGPSHLFARGRTLIVLDGNEGLLRRYELEADDAIGALTACSMPRNFSPRYVQSYATGIRILGEEIRPGATASNARLPTLVVEDALLSAMPSFRDGQAARPATCGDVLERPTSLPATSRRTNLGLSIDLPASAGARRQGVILVGPEAHAELLSARPIGMMDDYGPAVLRRELAGGGFGIVNVSLWVTLYKRSRPTSIRILDYRTNDSGEVTGLVKRGFEFAAVAGKSLYVLGTTCPKAFCINRYYLGDLPAGSGHGNNRVATIDLADGPGKHYREDAPLSEMPAALDLRDGIATFPGGQAWQSRLTRAVAAYAFNKWTFSSAARFIPCEKGPDHCAVRTRAGRLVDAARSQSEDGHVSQAGDIGDAVWWGPRNLIEAGASEPPLSQRGLPYSFGGNTTAKAFADAWTAPLHQPIGHIRETLVGVDSDEYPLGIDCSRFVGRIFGILKSTDEWITDPIDAEEVRRIKDLRYARPGDVIVKKGHIVIFNRVVLDGGNRSIEVFEATSRCGRVCRSVYDPDFFNGWRILRLRQMKGGGARPAINPFWPDSDLKS